MREKWSKGKHTGCVVSDTPNAHGNQTETTEYYGGYLVAESIPRQDHVNLIAAAPDLLSIAESLQVAISYPRGSEAQVRCLEEIAQDAERIIAKAKGEL